MPIWRAAAPRRVLRGHRHPRHRRPLKGTVDRCPSFARTRSSAAGSSSPPSARSGPHDFQVEHASPAAGLCPFCPGHEAKTPPEMLAYRPRGLARPTPRAGRLRVVPNKFPALRVEGTLDRDGEGVYDRMKRHRRARGHHRDARPRARRWPTCRRPSSSACSGPTATASSTSRATRASATSWSSRTTAQRGRVAGAHALAAHRAADRAQDRRRGDGGRRGLLRLQGALRLLRHHPPGAGATGAAWSTRTPSFVAIAPYAPRFPFETWILPQDARLVVRGLRRSEYAALANAMRTTLRRLDTALERRPTTSSLHTPPLRRARTEHYHWHIEIMPTLDRRWPASSGARASTSIPPPRGGGGFLREIKD